MTGEILMAHKNFEDFKEAVTEHYNNIEFPAGAIGELSETIVICQPKSLWKFCSNIIKNL